jgi:hypothetical protein
MRTTNLPTIWKKRLSPEEDTSSQFRLQLRAQGRNTQRGLKERERDGQTEKKATYEIILNLHDIRVH